MHSLIKKSSYKLSPWKNGQGVTDQIDIHPPTASVSAANFHYRLSSAHINGDNDFSSFYGFSRILIVCKGAGLLLNKVPLPTHTPHTFEGEDIIKCSLINDKVTDLGLIFNRSKFKATLALIAFKPEENVDLNLENAIHYFYLAVGDSIKINDLELSNGDTLKIENSTNIYLKSQTNCLLYHFTLNTIP